MMTLDRKSLIGLTHRIAYAALISALVWIFAGLPAQPVKPHSFDALLALVFDWPIAVATQALPCAEFAVCSVVYRRGRRALSIRLCESSDEP